MKAHRFNAVIAENVNKITIPNHIKTVRYLLKLKASGQWLTWPIMMVRFNMRMFIIYSAQLNCVCVCCVCTFPFIWIGFIFTGFRVHIHFLLSWKISKIILRNALNSIFISIVYSFHNYFYRWWQNSPFIQSANRPIDQSTNRNGKEDKTSIISIFANYCCYHQKYRLFCAEIKNTLTK